MAVGGDTFVDLRYTALGTLTVDGTHPNAPGSLALAVAVVPATLFGPISTA